ncbi:uncharacterized protein PgNI_09227 [Pyricularia grisea]|uniref:Uncharacterized protein n=1 Tax=Pyricularia grisea TaxID=148305 RepID=A0A6P8AS86_PYRGI|nr:uncharacterized protein PgNI_09227 [Pyricularia grisea]TLD04957.1 hypothetical protein PgNI_09227 [Pyricularia grisea]
MRFNHFLVPLMAGSVVSAPVHESEPKHQLEIRMNNPGTVAVGAAGVCVACAVGFVGYKSFKIAQETLKLTSAKYTVDITAANQATKIAADNQLQAEGKAVMDAFTKTIDMQTEFIDKNVEVIKKADPKNAFVKQYKTRLDALKRAYIQGLMDGATEFPAGKGSLAATASSTYCRGLQALLDESLDEMGQVEIRSRSPSPANPRTGTSSGSPGSLSRSNSVSSGGRPGNSGRKSSVVSSSSAGAQELRMAEEGGIQMQPLQNTAAQGTTGRTTATQGTASGSNAPPGQALTRRPTAKSEKLKTKTSNSDLKGKAPSVRRRMVPLMEFDV